MDLAVGACVPCTGPSHCTRELHRYLQLGRSATFISEGSHVVILLDPGDTAEDAFFFFSVDKVFSFYLP